jgi:hypothetical protein
VKVSEVNTRNVVSRMKLLHQMQNLFVCDELFFSLSF